MTVSILQEHFKDELGFLESKAWEHSNSLSQHLT